MSNQVDDYIKKAFPMPSSSDINVPDVLAQKTAAQEALETVEDRQAKYGPPDENFATIAKLWNSYISRKHGAEGSDKYPLFDLGDVAMMMMLVKVAREAYLHNRDNIVDIIGYAECYDRLGG